MSKLACILVLFAFFFAELAIAKTPIVLIPGLAGSWLEGKRTNGTYWCPTQHKYHPLWPNFNLASTCWDWDITIEYKNHKFVNYTETGMDVSVVDFGGVAGILNVTIQGIYMPYYQYIVGNLTEVYKYKVGKDLFGAPFDWRLTPQSLEEYFIDLKAYINYAYDMNNNAKVVVVAHSYGNMIFAEFLQRQPAAWKSAFIKEYVAISGPYLGSAEAIAAAVFGVVDGEPVYPLHFVLETFPSLYYLSPSVLPINPVLNQLLFNVSQYHSNQPPTFFYLNKASYQTLMSNTYLSVDWNEYEIWNDEQFDPRFNPGVKVSCYYGTQLPTAQSYNITLYVSTTVSVEPNNQDGDGVVLTSSGEYCKNWPNTKAYPVPKASHLGILQTTDILKAIVNAANLV